MKSDLAKARDKWLASDEGKFCCKGLTLEMAFIAGWEACIKNSMTEQFNNTNDELIKNVIEQHKCYDCRFSNVIDLRENVHVNTCFNPESQSFMLLFVDSYIKKIDDVLRSFQRPACKHFEERKED